MLRRHAWTIVVLLVLGGWLLGACQRPLSIEDGGRDGERPSNDDFAARAMLEGAVGTVSGSNVGATAEEGEPDHAGHPASRSVWWAWTAPASGRVTFDAGASEFGAVVGVYRGTAVASLTPVAQTGGTDASGDLAAFEVDAGDIVVIAVDGIAAASGTIGLDWAVDEPGPEDSFDGAFDPESVIFAGAVGGAAPAPRAVVLTNVGGAPASFTLASDRDWLSATPSAGTLDPGASAEVWIGVDACTAENSEMGSVFVYGGGDGATVAVRRDCTVPGEDPAVDLAIERVYVTQSVPAQDSAQPPAQQVPLVAGRPGLLRVFVAANEPNDVRPIVRLHYRHAGGPEEILDLTGPDAVPVAVDEGDLGHSFNALLDADVLRPGLEAYVVVELAGEADTSNNRFPPEGSWTPDVVVAPDARFTLVPVTYRGTTPGVGDGTAYLGLTERMFPLGAVDIEVRAPYAFTGDLGSGDGWYQLLQALTSLRTADASDRHYYGIVNPGYSGGIAGIAWVGYRPVAVGWHHLPSGAVVATHELGHNWGRHHAPCGVSGEPGYPYPGGVIGVWGYDRGTGQLKSPSLADVMSYCSPVWTSDYTYGGVLDYRVAYGYSVTGLVETVPTSVVIASGRVDDEAVELDPIFVLDGLPASVEPGPYALIGLGADGRELLRVAFEAAEVSHEHRRAFHLAIPVDAEAVRGLRDVRIERDGQVLVERRYAIRALATSPTELTVRPDGSVAITWDTGAFAELLVRDGRGGPVLGSDRFGELIVRPTGRVLELLFSDGVTTTREELRY